MTASRKTSPTRKTPTTAPRRAVIYVRISKARDGQHSTVTQESACRAFARANGWQVVAVEVDEGRSAYDGGRKARKAPRPAFERALGMIDNGLADVLLVWAVDRAARSTIDLDRMLHRLADNGAGFASATQGEMNTTTPMGVALLKIIGVLAELESAMKSERMLEHHAGRRRAGAPAGGPRTLGYQRDDEGELEMDGEEAQVVRDVFDWYLEGLPMNAIATRLNEAKVKSSTGKRIHCQTVRDLLSNPTVAGLFLTDGVLTQAPWEAIIDRDTWDRVQQLRTSTIKRRPIQRRHLLSGLLVCGRCGSNLRGGLHTKGPARYTCGGEGCFNGMIAAPLEQFVVGVILGNIDRGRWQDMRAASSGIDPTLELRGQLERLALDVANGDLSESEWQVMRPRLLERITAAEAQGVRRSDLPDVDDLGAAWDDLTLEQQRTVLAAVVERVELGPSGKAGRVDYSRIAITERV